MKEYGTALFDGTNIYDYALHESMDEAADEAMSWNEGDGEQGVTCIVVTRTAPVEAGPWEPAIYNPTDVKEALYGSGKMGAL